VPTPWWTDVFYLTGSALLPVAVVLGFRPTIRLVSRAALLDGALLIGALALLWWYFWLRPLDAGSGLKGVVLLAYPCLELIVLGIWTSASGPKQALRDPGTGAYGPEYLHDQLRLLVARARRFRNSFALALVDVDTASVGAAADLEVTRRVLEGGREVDSVAR